MATTGGSASPLLAKRAKGMETVLEARQPATEYRFPQLDDFREEGQNESGSEQEEEDEEMEGIHVSDVMASLSPAVASSYRFAFMSEVEEGLCQRISGALLYGQEKVGDLNAFLFRRDGRSGRFYTAADIEQDTLHMGRICCDRGGALKEPLKSACGEDANQGGLLYLDYVTVDKEHRGHDLGLHLVLQMLRYCIYDNVGYGDDITNGLWNPDLQDYARSMEDMGESPAWTLLITQPYIKEKFDRRRFLPQCPEREALEETPDEVASMARHFARLGMRQHPGKGDAIMYWYLERQNVPEEPLTPAQVGSLEIRQPALKSRSEASSATPAEEELVSELTRLCSRGAGAFFNRLDKELKQLPEGSIDRLCLMHHVIGAQGPMEVLQGLRSRGANVNSTDENGSTALHVASALANGFPDGSVVIRWLLAEGADKTLVNDDDQTALQCLLAAEESMADFAATFGLPPSVGGERVSLCKRLLSVQP